MSGIPAASTEPKMLDVKVVDPCSGPVAPGLGLPVVFTARRWAA